EGGDPAGHLPVKAVHETMNEPGAVGIPAPGGVDDGARRRARNRKLTLRGINHRALLAARHNERAYLLKHLADPPAALLLHELPFVVIHCNPARLRDEAREIGRVEHRQSLPRVEDERYARRGKLGGVFDHATTAVGRDDTYRDVARLTHP